jgi:membrane-bound metal-dependent hydrolase YbcI (DUF457 family)
MPSPIGHALGGLIVHAATAAPGELRDRRRAFSLAALAAAPDLDLLLKLFDGESHHRAASHSVGAALIVGVAVAVAARAAGRTRPATVGFAAGLAWLSHVVLDLLGADSFPPYGIMALWPLSERWLQAPVPVFLDIGRTLRWSTVWHNAVAAAWESVLLLPVLLAVARWRERRRS